jgi:uncharacterized membrane protein (DUF106 family)
VKIVINEKHVRIVQRAARGNQMSEIITTIPTATLIVIGISAGIAFLNSGINRLLINYFVGWEQYRVIQKELAEFRQESMAAAKSGDKKQMEKLKKKQSQINNMQAKTMKPTMVQFGISFVYLFVWFLVLTPTFGSTPMAYLPGIGTVANSFYTVDGVAGPAVVDAIPVFYWYPICSMFFGLIASRLIGIMPIEH